MGPYLLWAMPTYNGARIVQELNNARAQYFVPSELSRSSIAKGKGYSELVIERRDESVSDDSLIKDYLAISL